MECMNNMIDIGENRIFIRKMAGSIENRWPILVHVHRIRESDFVNIGESSITAYYCGLYRIRVGFFINRVFVMSS